MFGLAIHELGTNAAKYGALSSDRGAVEFTWAQTPEEEGSAVHVSWTERGGPTVVLPKRHGFGSRILEQLVARAVGGNVALNYAPEGLVWTLDFPRHSRPFMGEEAAI